MTPDHIPAGKPYRKRRTGNRWVIYAFLVIAALFFAVPLYVIVVTSLKSMDEIRQGAIFALPQDWTLEAWSFAWSKACAGTACNGVGGGFLNSLAIAVPSVTMSIGVAAVTGYALALWQIRWANTFLFILFMCAFVPFQIILFPLIKITAALNIYGSIFGIAVIHTVLALPILTLIFNNFYRDIPRDIMSAATIDSGAFLKIFVELILPMSGNILIVTLIMMVTNVWNDYLIGVTFGSQDTFPMTVILNNIASSATGEQQYNVFMAAALLTALPPLLVYFFLGRFFVQGITAGAIKG